MYRYWIHFLENCKVEIANLLICAYYTLLYIYIIILLAFWYNTQKDHIIYIG